MSLRTDSTEWSTARPFGRMISRAISTRLCILPCIGTPLYATNWLLMMSIEIETKIRNAAHYLRMFRNETCCNALQILPDATESLVYGSEHLWFDAPLPPQRGQEKDGNSSSPAAASCAQILRRNFVRPEIRTQRRSGHAGLTFDRQHELGRNAALRSLEPIPDLGLCGADAVR